MLVAGTDAKVVCGADQLCAGLEEGIEAAVDAMNDIFNDQAGSGKGVLLVDAANAFIAEQESIIMAGAVSLASCGPLSI